MNLERINRFELSPTDWKSVMLPLHHIRIIILMEQVKGIEPSTSVWQTEILPFNYTCTLFNIILKYLVTVIGLEPITSFRMKEVFYQLNYTALNIILLLYIRYKKGTLLSLVKNIYCCKCLLSYLFKKF